MVLAPPKYSAKKLAVGQKKISEARKISADRKISRAERAAQQIFHTQVREQHALQAQAEAPAEKPAAEKLQQPQQQQQQPAAVPSQKQASNVFNVSLHPFWPFMHLGGNKKTVRWVPKNVQKIWGSEIDLCRSKYFF